LSNLLTLFANNILPIFLAAGSGYVLAKVFNIKPHALSQVAFFLFSPCLIFKILTSTKLASADVLRMVAFTMSCILGIGILSWVIGRLLKFDRRLLVAVVLGAMFGNSGNFGLSLNLFAFGETSLPYASLFFVTSSIMMYTVGVVIASLGSSGFYQAFLGLFKVPVIYAVFLAFIVNSLHIQMPLPLDRTVTLLGDAAIPLLMVLIGVQLANAQWDGNKLALGITNVMRLAVAPAFALALSMLFGLRGEAFQAGVTEAGTPTAVVMTVLATQYDVEPSFLTAVVVTSTLLCPITLTPLLAYLGA
jgi:hypothetical protein